MTLVFIKIHEYKIFNNEKLGNLENFYMSSLAIAGIAYSPQLILSVLAQIQ